MQNPIIIALDNVNRDTALKVASEVSGSVWGFKVNDLFIEQGPQVVRELSKFGRVMLDLKIYDIPNTAKNDGNKIAEVMPLVDIVTTHIHGGIKMMSELVKRLPGKVAGITVLTSFDEKEYQFIHKTSATIPEMVQHLYKIAADTGVAYVVCSGQELMLLPKDGPAKIVPGVRPSWHQKVDDQKRTLTPKEAIDRGANFLVIGRPILEAESPKKAVDDTCKEIGL